MKTQKNLISFNFATSPDLAEFFAGKRSGDKCEATIRFMLTEVNDKTGTAEGVIEKVYSDYEDEEKEAEPTPTAPMAIEMKPSSNRYG